MGLFVVTFGWQTVSYNCIVTSIILNMLISDCLSTRALKSLNSVTEHSCTVMVRSTKSSIPEISEFVLQNYIKSPIELVLFVAFLFCLP